MANFNKAYEILLTLEFNDASNALHQNPTEKGLTFMGIYEKAHPNWAGWLIVKDMLKKLDNIKKASVALMQEKELLKMVAHFYKVNFWDKIAGDEIASQHVANEIFIFGVNVGVRQAIKTAQRLLNLGSDGIMGAQTLSKLNNVDVAWFDKAFDSAEVSYYDTLIDAKPNLKIYANGWRNRAKRV